MCSPIYALDAFAIGGVDMTTPEPIEQAFGVLDDIVNRLEALI
jgi:oligoendopeptidase F